MGWRDVGCRMWDGGMQDVGCRVSSDHTCSPCRAGARVLSWLVQGFERMVPQPEVPKKPEVSTAAGAGVASWCCSPLSQGSGGFPWSFPAHSNTQAAHWARHGLEGGGRADATHRVHCDSSHTRPCPSLSLQPEPKKERCSAAAGGERLAGMSSAP